MADGRERADSVRPVLLACFQQIELAERELALSRSLLDRAIQALDSADDAAELLPQIDALLGRRLEELRQTVSADVATSPRARTGPFRFRMDHATKSAQVGERRIPLSEREFAVLELLWEEMPRPVSRMMLMKRLFGAGKAPDGAAADWYIFQVRQKLRNAACTDAEIRSVRGRGWVLDLAGSPARSDVEIFPRTRLRQTNEPAAPLAARQL